MPTVLFLCTGNYYRSRFAEVYFNWLAERAASSWKADSRGLALDPFNAGHMSRHAQEGLARLEIALPSPGRFPRDVAAEDFSAATHIVAVKATEHRPLMTRRFPDWVERVEYWEVHDLDCATADEALPELEQRVRELFDRLQKVQG